MRFIDAAAIDSALDPVFMADALRDAFAGDIVVPVRHHHDIHRPDGEATLLLMPAWTGASQTEAFVGTKIVSVRLSCTLISSRAGARSLLRYVRSLNPSSRKRPTT